MKKCVGRQQFGSYNSWINKIRISKGINSRKTILGVAKHEGLHFFTRFGYLQVSCPYLDEGCTEYLKHLSESPEDKYSYREQVEAIEFLRSLLGNSIIQTYLTSKGKHFLDDLNNVLSEKIKSEDRRKIEIEEFMDHLDDRHYELRRREKYLSNFFTENEVESDESIVESEEDVEKNDEAINEFLQKLILCKFAQMARTRKFNKNGKVDEEFAKSVIKEKLKNAIFVGGEFDFYENKTERANLIIEIMMEKILYEIRENRNPKVKVNTYFEHKKKMCSFGIFSIDEIYSIIFDSKDNMSMITFWDYLIKAHEELGLPSEEICEKYGAKKFFKLILSNSSRNLAVFNLLAKEITSEESHFRKIGDSEYVEQRDGAFVYLKINDDGTIQEETDLSKVKNIFKIGDDLESIRLVNREDDYRELGILGEEQFQQVEMVHQMIQSILYQKNVDVENIVKDINIIIQDSKFLSRLVETTLKKRTRLQVMDWINTLTKEEMQQVLEQIYDEAVISSGIREIEQKQELDEFIKNMYDYECRKTGREYH